MSTSSGRTILLEAAGAAVLAAGGIALASPHDVWLAHVGFHPAWIAVLLLAAHYGSMGLFLALGLCVAALSAASLALGNSLDGLAARASNASDLFALAAAILIAWLGFRVRGRGAATATA